MTQSEWSETEISRAFDANATVFSGAAAVMGGETLQIDAMLVAATKSKLPFFNQAVGTARLADPETGIRTAISFFEERRLSFTVGVLGNDNAAARATEEAGLSLDAEMPLMLLDPKSLQQSLTAVPHLEIRPAVRGNLDEHVGERMRPDARNAYRDLIASLLTLDQFQFWYGYLEGRGVSTAASWTSNGLVGVFSVATAPEVRRQGIGEALTAAAIRGGFENGAEIAYLFSTEMGRGIYERMGFTAVSSHRYYVSPT